MTMELGRGLCPASCCKGLCYTILLICYDDTCLQNTALLVSDVESFRCKLFHKLTLPMALDHYI